MMTVGSLFSGIGGLDLGLERAGMTVRWQSEIDPYCCRVLAKHWPDVPNWGDVAKIDWSTVEPVDLICGGYPCQPFSLAGARAGEADVRHLWPRFRDAIRHLRPRYALLENVPGHLSLGFGSVLGDLAELGYNTEWDCIPAAAVGAPHLRYRIFVVAYPNGESEPGVTINALKGSGFMVPDTNGHTVRQQPVGLGRGGDTPVVAVDGVERDVADTDRAGRVEQRRTITTRPSLNAAQRGGDVSDAMRPRPSSTGRHLEPIIPTSDHQTARGHWRVEPDVGRVAHGVPNRVDRLRALGNAVVPQVAELIGRRIMVAAA